MTVYSIEQSITEGDKEIKALFEYVQNHATEFELYDIEKYIFSAVMNVGLAALKCYFAQRGTGDIGSKLITENGIELPQTRRLRQKTYFSIFGKIKISRTCYRDRGYDGIMPLDAQVNLPVRCYSYLLQEWMNLCSVRDTFAESATTLNTLLGLDIKASRFEIVNQESTGSYDKFYKNKAMPSAQEEGQIRVVSFDGKGVPVIKKEAAKIQSRKGKGKKRQKTKEAMVGISYTIDPNIRNPEEVAENLVFPEKAQEKKKKLKEHGKAVPEVKAKNIRRMASLERTKKEVANEILKDTHARLVNGKEPLIVVMDGALSLWILMATVLSGVKWVGILDIIHVVEYLWKVGNALHGEQTPEAKKWVHKQLLAILEGRVGRVIGGLKQTKTKRTLSASQTKAVDAAVSYFTNHREWMRYDEYLSAGYPIGSGVVESTCGHTVKSRMEGAGRRWSIKGAESTLLLRSIYTSKDWDDYWATHRSLVQIQEYSETLKIINSSDDYGVEIAA